MFAIISGLNALSVGLGWLGENARGIRSLNILTGTSEALMWSLWKLVEGTEAPRINEWCHKAVLWRNQAML